MRTVTLKDAEVLKIHRPDGTVLYVSDDYAANGFHVFSDGPFQIKPRSDNSILIRVEETASVRRQKERFEREKPVSSTQS